MGLTVVVGRTTAEAEQKFAEYARYASAEAGLAHFAAGSGIDYSKFDLDDELEHASEKADLFEKVFKRKLRFLIQD